MTLTADLLALPAPNRYRILGDAHENERTALLAAIVTEYGSIWPLWWDDPVGFVTQGLGETMWSKQAQWLAALGKHDRVAVPSAFETGKSHTAARAGAWFLCSNVPGTAMLITTAHRWRQVKMILWPYMRRIAERYGLPGTLLTTEWKMGGDVVGFGLVAAKEDPDAIQGFHAPKVMVIIDEAGGIPFALGQAFEALLGSAGTTALAIGNPPLDDEASWFESITADPDWYTLSISAFDTPNLTGEVVPVCHACHPLVPPHTIDTHLVTEQWTERQLREYGEESAWYQAKVLARFPRGTPLSCVPAGALDDAIERARPDSDDRIEPGQPVKLGVDVASDGGDELVVARKEGALIRIVRTAAGPMLANSMDVAGLVLLDILDAERIAAQYAAETGTEPQRVVVNVDSIGVGWGVWSTLSAWGGEGRHHATVLRIDAGSAAADGDRFANVKAEMWWNMRERCVDRTIALDIDEMARAQLVGPRYGFQTNGRIKIETKEQLRKRGLRSPDRAEALVLAAYGHSAPPVTETQPASWRLPDFDPTRRR